MRVWSPSVGRQVYLVMMCLGLAGAQIPVYCFVPESLPAEALHDQIPMRLQADPLDALLR